jgi:hypothetical protein
VPGLPEQGRGGLSQQPMLAERDEVGVGKLQLRVHDTGLDSIQIGVSVPCGDGLADQFPQAASHLHKDGISQQRRHQQVAFALK